MRSSCVARSFSATYLWKASKSAILQYVDFGVYLYAELFVYAGLYHAGEIEYLAARGASQVHQYQCLPFMDAYPSASAAFSPALSMSHPAASLALPERAAG